MCLAGGVALADNDNFEKDTALSIDLGLAWLDSAGAFNNPSSAGDAAGLTLLALLEKRASGIPSDPPQGYAGANAADQARMRRVIRYILNQVNAQGASFYSYRDGGYMMALSLYMRTGGVDKDDGPTSELDGAPLTLIQALDKVFDRTYANQRRGLAGGDGNNGYWCYTNNGCLDASTTQLTLSGLAGARAIYSSGGFKPDALRDGRLDEMTTTSRKGYQANGTPGQASVTCGVLPNEKGHGYNVGNANSLHQTSSGIWAQLLGGADLNDADVQAYLRWVYNRYRYTDLGSVNGGWSQSTWYYLWTATKAFEFLESSGVVPGAGKLEPADLGSLPAASAPACAQRQENRNPAADARIPLFGAQGPGYYEEDKNWYYDFAYTIMSRQCSAAQGNQGFYGCNGAPGSWNNYSRQSYALLVLQRSVGGGCIDTDGDGECDETDNCVNKANPGQEDKDGDGVGDACDNCPDVANRDQKDSNGNGIGDACEGGKCDLDKDGDIDKADISVITGLRGQTSPPANSDADADGNGLININDARACTLKCTRPRCRLR